MSGDFGVDKKAQAEVAAAMDKFLREDGGLLMYVDTAITDSVTFLCHPSPSCTGLTIASRCFLTHFSSHLYSFPEGQLNKTPRKIQTLRRGAFTLAIAHKKPIWGFINVGCEKAWPYTSAMGGFPCDIYVRAFKVTDDASKFDNIQLADHAGKIMQEQLDEIYNIIDNKKFE